MTLAAVYAEHSEALEADFLHFWNQDIEEMELRRIRNLFFRLPYNSETHYDIRKVPRESRYWDVNTYVLATIADLIMTLDWHFVAANSKHAPKPPKMIQRPLLEEEIKRPKKGYWPGRTIVDKGNSND